MMVRQADANDAAWLQTSFDTRMGWTKPEGYFARCIEQQENNEIELLVAIDGSDYAGHLKVAWLPDYPYFRENNIPEIQGLNVLPVYRRQRVATLLVDTAEDIMRTRSKIAGIGVGLYADYGAAQRMYIKRGYVPDGRGIFYDDQPVKPGTPYPVDDALVLHLTKHL